MLYDRRFFKESLWWIVPMLLAVIAAVSVRERVGEAVASRWSFVVIGIALIAIVGGFCVEWRQWRRFDELQQRLYLEGWMFAGFAGMLYAIYGVFAGLSDALPPTEPAGYLVCHALGWLLGCGLARRRYR